MDTSRDNRSKNNSNAEENAKPETGMFTDNNKDKEKSVSEASSDTSSETDNNNKGFENMLQMIQMINMLKGTQQPTEESAEIKSSSIPKDDVCIQDFQTVQAVTPFDDMLQTPALKALKAAIPYLEPQQQKNIGLFVKLFEIQQLMNIYSNEGQYAMQSQNQYPNNRTAVLTAMRTYVPKEKQPMIDILIKIIDIKEIYEKIR